MAVKTTKEREEELKDSSPKIKTKETKIKAKDKFIMYLPQITGKGEYNLLLNYKGKKEKIKSKNGVVLVNKDDVEKYKSCGFKMMESKIEKFHTYYSPEYSDKSFNLVLDDGTKLAVDKGICTPKNKYQESQLIKNHFRIYKLKK